MWETPSKKNAYRLVGILRFCVVPENDFVVHLLAQIEVYNDSYLYVDLVRLVGIEMEEDIAAFVVDHDDKEMAIAVAVLVE